ncbi:hypothetical protein NUW54_g12406 [Trametes sanguinea]|uniref:Uncharacterized protein n=1 Tax=Trametes sanguinea TaxID=158606 RepID=A0ACC1MYV9_9APHY|nr:hypothetical protein NUW54_g12406 [Trametes sanguinea]
MAIQEVNYDAIPGDPDDPVQDRSWMWQYCSEYGFYQRGDPNNPLSIETSFRSLELFQEECNAAFPQGLPPSPAVEKVNKYGGWNMTPSNVLFTNGEFDPWRTMGLASIESNSPMRSPSVAVPRCNVAPEFPSFFGLTHANMVHVSDLRVLLTPDANHTDFKTVGFYSPVSQEPFYSGLGLFEMALDEWLPCFGQDSRGSKRDQEQMLSLKRGPDYDVSCAYISVKKTNLGIGLSVSCSENDGEQTQRQHDGRAPRTADAIHHGSHKRLRGGGWSSCEFLSESGRLGQIHRIHRGTTVLVLVVVTLEEEEND